MFRRTLGARVAQKPANKEVPFVHLLAARLTEELKKHGSCACWRNNSVVSILSCDQRTHPSPPTYGSKGCHRPSRWTTAHSRPWDELHLLVLFVLLDWFFGGWGGVVGGGRLRHFFELLDKNFFISRFCGVCGVLC